ncbi:MAG: SURF1 family protein [Pseudomonadota bacterium]|nr:SURF1 family protein [Pseudomonadota bacterium]
MKAFRPTLWATVFTMTGVALLLGLGFWQLERLEWKTALLATIRERTTAPSISLQEALVLKDQAEWRHVHASGYFLYGKELYRLAPSEKGQPGWHTIIPMKLDNGRILLVNRGWLSEESRQSAKRDYSLLPERSKITGTLRLPNPPGALARWAGVRNNPRQNRWQWIDIPAMASAANTDPALVLPVVLDTSQPRLSFPNNHLQYALTWFSLAAALLVVWGIKSLDSRS